MPGKSLDSDVASYVINDGHAMFGIGQFAQLAKVSVRTLRHYDHTGLFEPASVEGSSGYRAYRASQLPEFNRIRQPVPADRHPGRC